MNRKSLSSLDCKHPIYSRRSIVQRVWGAWSPITSNQAARASICECFYASRQFSNACWWEERGSYLIERRRRRDAADSQDQRLPRTRGRFGTFAVTVHRPVISCPLRKSVTHIRQLNPHPRRTNINEEF